MNKPDSYPPERAFVHNALNELYELHERPFEATPDIDIVWAVSSVGTVKEAADLGPDNPYSGELWDLGIVDNSVRVVREVTALRLNKPVEEITPEDIEAAGPTLLYNGETPGLPHSKFPQQNKHFEELVSEPGFPIPRSKIVIGELDDANTVAQVRQIADHLHEQGDMRKIAVVCGLPHATRVGRYIEHHRGLFPGDTAFVAAPVGQGDLKRQSSIAALELRKARNYRAKGHLAVRSAFFPNGATSRRPDVLKNHSKES
ncbi:MAG TPA: hypothetical protein VIQ80_00220 [Candidatus Saccharimonadales bacterium]